MSIAVTTLSPTTRFSNRVENYVKYRPGYPKEIIPFFENELGLKPGARIADIGSGTGLFAEPLLQNGYPVICIEPNEEMRKAGEERLKKYMQFSNNHHAAEATGLPDHSIDLITVAQAFHWMDAKAAREEFSRILKPGAYTVLAWNILKTDTYFLETYSSIKERYRIEEKDTHNMQPAQIAAFFKPAEMQRTVFPNVQLLDFDALKGQLLSSSYIPLPGHPSYETMISELVQLFVAANENGFVKMEFDTILYYGQIQ